MSRTLQTPPTTPRWRAALGWRHPMVRRIGLVMALTTATVWLVAAAPEVSNVANRRQTAQKRMAEGNFRDALTIYRTLLTEAKAGGQGTAGDLAAAAQCLQNLGETNDLNALIESAVTAHPKDWRVLAAAATQYRDAPAFGTIIAGNFERGGRRGGEYANSAERDRVRAIQLFLQAAPLADADDAKPEVANFYRQFAQTILPANGANEAWRLTAKTDTETLPDVELGYPGGRDFVGVPCDAEGKPVFWSPAKDWASASNDGDRWRWAAALAIENDPGQRNAVHRDQAAFFRDLYGVQTMQSPGFPWNPWATRDDEADNAATKRFQLETLAETETLARTARGIQRFDLPDSSNHIKLWQSIAESKTGDAEAALGELTQVFLNRRQYPQAAKLLEQSIARFGDPHKAKSSQLGQIVDAWGEFQPVATLPAGTKVELPFKFRNSKSVTFVARAVDVKKLLDDVRTYLQSKPDRFDWNRVQIENLGWQIIQQDKDKYVAKEETARWKRDLEPRPDHFDRLITVDSPLTKPGAFLVTALMPGGHQSSILVWVADTAIIRKPLSEQNLYYVADAVSGRPLAGVTVDFFGYQQEYLGDGRVKITTRRFTETTDKNGLTIPSAKDLIPNFSWLITVRGKDKESARFAYMGFDSVWTGRYHDAQYNATKIFTITDRPVYRPDQTVHFKAWLRHAQYDQETTSDFAGATCNVTIRDPRNQVIYEKTLTADAYGGVEGDLLLPPDATLGTYNLQVQTPPQLRAVRISGGNSFRVEEYKKPEFEVSIDAPSEPVMLGDKVTAKVTAKYYFGSPVTQGTVKLKVLRSEHDATWYPIRPWDWCYGSGYWWFAYDYTWYPGWDTWRGCVRPIPSWGFRGDRDPPEVVLEQELPLSDDGTVSVEIDTAVAKALFGNHDHKYAITAEVRDQSRRTIVGNGTVLVARKPFTVYTWLDRGYYRAGDRIGASFLAQTLDRKPVAGKGVVTLYQISYEDGRTQPKETPVNTWDVTFGETGRVDLPIRAADTGQYRVACVVTDEAGHEIEGGYIFTIVGDDVAAKDFRFNAIELIPEKETYQDGETVKLQINTNQPDSTVLLFLRPSNGIYLPPQVLHIEGRTTTVDLGVTKKDMPNFFVEATTIAAGRAYDEAREIIVPPETRVLNVALDPNAKTYKPGEEATVAIQVTDHTGENFEGSCVVSIYDKSVEYISGGSNVPDIREFFWKWRRSHNPSRSDTLSRMGFNVTRPGQPSMQPLGVFGQDVAADGVVLESEVRQQARFRGAGSPGGMTYSAAPAAPMSRSMAFGAVAPMSAPAPMADAAMVGGMEGMAFDKAAVAGEAGGAESFVEPSIRSNFADTALWVGRIDTDKTGQATVKLTMPENLTAWKVQTWSMGHGTKVGHGVTEVVTRKDLLVRMQTPRFFVERDEVVLTANVHNYLPNEKTAKVVLDVPNDMLAVQGDAERSVTIPSGGEVRVDWRVRVVGEGNAKIVMKALTDTESDAVEMTIPAKVHGMLKTEAWAGTVRPDQDSAELVITVPDARRAEQTVLEVRFSPTLAAAMVEALPYMLDFPYGCTEQTLNRFLPAAVTKKSLVGLGIDLAAVRKTRTNLNAQEIGDAQTRSEGWKRLDRSPVFDDGELDTIVGNGVDRLANMQNGDGGWGWFYGSGERSYGHTTAVVVHGLIVAREADVKLPEGMLDRGVEWLSRYADEQVQLIENHKANKKPAKASPDNLDAFVTMVLAEAGRDPKRLRELAYESRNDLAVYAKACLALACQTAGEADRVTMLRRNIEQFLVIDEENETAYLKLPESNWWWMWYGSEIEADAFYLKLLTKVDAKGTTAPRLVKYLLNNRKHATYWNSTRDTAYVIEAFADYLKATGETRPEMTVEVWLDDKKLHEVSITPETLFSFDGTAVLAGADVPSGSHTVRLVRKGKGPVYFNAYLTNFTLEEPIKAAGLEIKVNRSYYKLVPTEASVLDATASGQAADRKIEKFNRVPIAYGDAVTSGDLIEVELTLESKNEYEYILFEDYKAAGCEPVEVRSGYTNQGLSSYVEYRDDRVTFFCRQLPRGTSSVRYRVRAEIPGRFAALPTAGLGMYAPELRANSDELKLVIQDQDQPAAKAE